MRGWKWKPVYHMVLALKYLRNLFNLLNYSLVCMSWPLHGSKSNAGLIQQLCDIGIIKSMRAADAMKAVDRANYAPYMPYEDRPQGIGYGATISAPHMHATALQELEAAIMVDISPNNGMIITDLYGYRKKMPRYWILAVDPAICQ